jgi:hypothetical protein
MKVFARRGGRRHRISRTSDAVRGTLGAFMRKKPRNVR